MPLRLLLLTFSLVVPTAAFGQSLVEKAENDELYVVDEDDKEMNAAYRKAKEGLEAFLAKWRDPSGQASDFAVKIGISEGESSEFFWISPFREDAGQFSGTIDNEPRFVKSVQNGEEIAFKKKQIVDWLYSERGRMVGNFTACAMLQKAPLSERRAFEERFGLRCEA